MKLIICRHGETKENKEKRLQGKLETVLNETGKNQAMLVAEKLKNETFYRVFSSPQKRCKETISEIMKYHDLPIEYTDNLREIDVGKYSGMSIAEINKKFPGDWDKRVNKKYDFLHEGGESYKQVDENRVKPLLKEFQEKYSSRKILICTHQGTGRLIIGNLMGLMPEEKMKIDFPNDCIYYIEYLPHKTAVKYYLAQSGKEGEGILKREIN